MPNILIIDNFDSFTYNIVHQVAAITGERPTVRQNDALSWRDVEQGGFEAVIISPGPGTPADLGDFGVNAEIIRKADIPILGVCLGHQGIGLQFGAGVARAPEPVHGQIWKVTHRGDTLFDGIPAPFEATRYHSLIVERPLPPELEEIAWTDEGLLMALRHRTRPIWGIQFHLESIGTPHGSRLLANFLRLGMGSGKLRAAPARVGVKGGTDRTRTVSGHTERLRLFHRVIATTALDASFFRRVFGASPDSFWLDSSAHGAGRGRFSYMGDARGPRGRVLRFSRSGQASDAEGARQFARALAEAARTLRAAGADLPFAFTGGAVGYFGYEFRGGVEPRARFETPHADAQFILADRFVAIDHDSGKSYAVHIGAEAEKPRIEAWFDQLQQACDGCDVLAPTPVAERVTFGLDHKKSDYLALIERALAFIREGLSYEICLTNQIRTRASPDRHALYAILRALNPAPYSALLSFGTLAILSSSPECFLQLDASGLVTARPIKGTIGRSADPEEDRALAARLRASAKDRAENLMITDLMRNDLGRVCEIGSVHVDRLMEVESYQTVHQLVTTVTGRLAPGRDFVDCLLAAFPGGSMTGAPKTRTLALIEQLERAPRGIYSGAIGFLGADGSAEMNIVIRTIVMDEQGCSIGVGGAVVAASDPEAEYAETLLKGRALMEAISQCVTGDRRRYAIEEGIGRASTDRS
ncbi:MAG TPA: aminodeoxychorismate synthase component I [Allosphingosinicella sp.]|nr:aminodeoxychorismate synthase component I [Allosphingosinicella sp.]